MTLGSNLPVEVINASVDDMRNKIIITANNRDYRLDMEPFDITMDTPSSTILGMIADICTLRDAAAFISFVANFGVMQISEFIETGVQKNHIITKKYDIKQVI